MSVVITPSVGQTKEWDNITPSTAYKFFYPGAQGTGDLTDQSGQGNNAAAEANLTDGNMWANAGYFSSVAGQFSGIAIPAAVLDWDMALGQSIILSFSMNIAVAVDDGLAGEHPSAGAGIRYIGTIAGTTLTPYISDGSAEESLGSFGAVLDGANHNVLIAIDGGTKMGYTFTDGEAVGIDVNVSAVTGSTVSANDFVFGSDFNGAAAKTYAGQFGGGHGLVFQGGLPGNLTELAKKIHSSPLYPLSVSDVGE